jgi:hypothetical protein
MPRGASGVDYLRAAAADLDPRSEIHREVGAQFLSLIRAGGLGPANEHAMLGVEVFAQRGLEVWEVHAIATIGAAYDVAMRDRNQQAAREVLDAGLVLLARWPKFYGYLHAADDS